MWADCAATTPRSCVTAIVIGVATATAVSDLRLVEVNFDFECPGSVANMNAANAISLTIVIKAALPASSQHGGDASQVLSLERSSSDAAYETASCMSASCHQPATSSSTLAVCAANNPHQSGAGASLWQLSPSRPAGATTARTPDCCQRHLRILASASLLDQLALIPHHQRARCPRSSHS